MQQLVEELDVDKLIATGRGCAALTAIIEGEVIPRSIYGKFREVEKTFYGTERKSGESSQAHATRVRNNFGQLKSLKVNWALRRLNLSGNCSSKPFLLKPF